MAEALVRVPPDSTGARLRHRSQQVAAEARLEQAVFLPGLPTFRLLCESGAPAANKYHLYLGNNAASGQTLYLVGLYVLNLQTAAITGVINRFNMRRVTGTPTLTAVTPYAFNSALPALANVTAGHTVTAGLTDSTIVLPLILSSEEQTAVPANTGQHLHHLNLLPPAHPHACPMALRPGEAMAIRQVDAGTVGGFAWIMDFAVELDS